MVSLLSRLRMKKADSYFSSEITRFDTAEVAEAERIQEEMARNAKKELREAKRNDRRQEIEERKIIKAHFSDVKAKFKK